MRSRLWIGPWTAKVLKHITGTIDDILIGAVEEITVIAEMFNFLILITALWLYKRMFFFVEKFHRIIYGLKGKISSTYLQMISEKKIVCIIYNIYMERERENVNKCNWRIWAKAVRELLVLFRKGWLIT